MRISQTICGNHLKYCWQVLGECKMAFVLWDDEKQQLWNHSSGSKLDLGIFTFVTLGKLVNVTEA